MKNFSLNSASPVSIKPPIETFKSLAAVFVQQQQQIQAMAGEVFPVITMTLKAKGGQIVNGKQGF